MTNHPDTMGAVANERAAAFRRSAESRHHGARRKGRHRLGLRNLLTMLTHG
jgi:hypothetical protein